MKNIFYFILTIMVLIAVALNTGDVGQENQTKPTNDQASIQATNSMSTTLTSGLEQVLESLDELRTESEKAPGNNEEIRDVAKKLSEDWDKIEKQVEEKYPESYENIEKSLYPLLAEAQKEYPNLVSVRQLLEATTIKVDTFKKSVGKTSS